MHRHTFIICKSVWIGRLRRARSEHGLEVDTCVLDLHVRCSYGADVATRAGEGHPWRRGVNAVRMIRVGGSAKEGVSVVEIEVSPVGEWGLWTQAGRCVFQITIGRRRHTMTVRIDAS